MSDSSERPIDVKITARRLPADVVEWRLEAAADKAATEAVAQPRIEAVLTACKLAAQDLVGLHSGYAD
ncbi:MAG: hypothetical protein ACJ76Q_08940 [Solirubrobacteraceae bacterium]